MAAANYPISSLLKEPLSECYLNRIWDQSYIITVLRARFSIAFQSFQLGLLLRVVEERCIVISLPVCVSVCPRAYIWNRWTDPRGILCADPLWPWLGPPLATLRYVMYFRFMDDVTFGRCAVWRRVASGVAIPGRSLMSMNALFIY